MLTHMLTVYTPKLRDSPMLMAYAYIPSDLIAAVTLRHATIDDL